MRLKVLTLVAAGTFCQALYPQDKPPLATLTVGYTYLYADQGMNYRSNLNGWFARPDMTIGKGYSAFADFTNYYGGNKKGSINSHGYTFGLAKGIFTHPRFQPSIFAEAGDVRTSNAGTIVNQLDINAGFSISLPLQHGFSFVITPAEYVFCTRRGTGATTLMPRSASAMASANASRPPTICPQ